MRTRATCSCLTWNTNDIVSRRGPSFGIFNSFRCKLHWPFSNHVRFRLTRLLISQPIDIWKSNILLKIVIVQWKSPLQKIIIYFMFYVEIINWPYMIIFLWTFFFFVLTLSSSTKNTLFTINMLIFLETWGMHQFHSAFQIVVNQNWYQISQLGKNRGHNINARHNSQTSQLT